MTAKSTPTGLSPGTTPRGRAPPGPPIKHTLPVFPSLIGSAPRIPQTGTGGTDTEDSPCVRRSARCPHHPQRWTCTLCMAPHSPRGWVPGPGLAHKTGLDVGSDNTAMEKGWSPCIQPKSQPEFQVPPSGLRAGPEFIHTRLGVSRQVTKLSLTTVWLGSHGENHP